MSGYTLRAPNVILTTLIQDGQAVNSISAQDMRDDFTSAMGIQGSIETLSYTLVLTDAFLCVEMISASAVNVTIPPNSSVAFQVGTTVSFLQYGAGQVTLVPGVGVTLRTASSLTTRIQYSSIGIRQRAINEWVVTGDTT